MRCPKPRPVRNSWEAGIFKKLSASKRVARRDRAALLARADEVIEQADMSVSETAPELPSPEKPPMRDVREIGRTAWWARQAEGA